MTRRRQCFIFLALLLGGAVIALVTLGILRAGGESRAPAALASSQWQRLTQKITRSAALASSPTLGSERRPATALDSAVLDPEEFDPEEFDPEKLDPEALGKEVSASAVLDPAVLDPEEFNPEELEPKLLGLEMLDRGALDPAVLDPEMFDPKLLERQAAEYDAHRPKSVIELQRFRRTSRAPIADAHGRSGNAELIDLSPRVGSWYLLRLSWDGEETASYHLINSRPKTHELSLDAAFPGGLVFDDASGRTRCTLWSDDSASSLAAASQLATPYVTLCDDRVALRRPTAGRRTQLEWAADFLRDNVWAGEALTVLVRDSLYQDAHLVQGELIAGASPAALSTPPSGPRPANIATEHVGDLLVPVHLGVALETPLPRLSVGAWSAARDNAGVFVSVLQPDVVEPAASEAGRRVAGQLDKVEAQALVYLVAFDLARFEINFAVGTDHPRVGWSERIQPAMRDDALPGPDGIANLTPLVAGGIIPFALAERTVASFAGGFKRSHGAFKSGVLARQNSGSHYGFIESGVVLSKLQPGLATIFALDDGRVEMKTWSSDDDVLIERIKFARQNGVPIVETDPETDMPMPGALVTRWADGNWSGSAERLLRSVRAGICLQESDDGRFLLYGYFSSATPVAMARVFQAYGCGYAMSTDMNALEHTYLALYRVEASRLVTDHLIVGMEVLDKVVDGHALPRFLGFADNRDFFYVMRREAARRDVEHREVAHREVAHRDIAHRELVRGEVLRGDAGEQ